jgi:protein required for attachment to host cells
MKSPKTWIVLADGERARVLVRRSEMVGLETIHTMESTNAHRRTTEFGADKPGRTQESVGGARHAVEPRADLHRRDKVEFASLVAAALDAAASRREFDRIVLVALPSTAAAIRRAMSRGTAQKIEAEIHKDLTKTPDQEIADWLAESAGAAA